MVTGAILMGTGMQTLEQQPMKHAAVVVVVWTPLVGMVVLLLKNLLHNLTGMVTAKTSLTGMTVAALLTIAVGIRRMDDVPLMDSATQMMMA